MTHSVQPKRPDPDDPAAIRGDIEEVRAELSETVNALAYKVDVKSRAQEKAQEIKAVASERAEEIKAAAGQTAQQLAGIAQQRAQQVQHVAREKPRQAAAVGGAVLALLALLRLRRSWRRRHAQEDVS